MADSQPGTLYLLPNTLGKTPENNTIPEYVLNIIRKLDYMLVENIPSAVKYLQWVGDTVPDYEIDFRPLNKKTSSEEMAEYLRPIKKGRDAGILSEAGCPGVADPGSRMVKLAHNQGITVVPLVGPSSLLLALMASGMSGQRFAFHGYLPRDGNKRRKTLEELEKESASKNQTQLFMETPYRNNEMLADVLKTCRPNTRLCTATNVTLPDEQIVSRSIKKWQTADEIDLNKKPTIFLIQAG